MKLSNFNFINNTRARVAMVGTLAYVTASSAMAAGNRLEVGILSEFGCSLLDFFTGSLAVWAFILVAAGILVIGLLAKVDFSRLIAVVVVFGVLQGLGSWVAPMLTKADSCIANNGH